MQHKAQALRVIVYRKLSAMISSGSLRGASAGANGCSAADVAAGPYGCVTGECPSEMSAALGKDTDQQRRRQHTNQSKPVSVEMQADEGLLKTGKRTTPGAARQDGN